MTLLELFAYMTEMALFRLNQVPEKNYIKYLEMIGIENVRMLNTPGAVLLGIVYGYLPLMIMPIYASMSAIDPFTSSCSSRNASVSWLRTSTRAFPTPTTSTPVTGAPLTAPAPG